MQVKQLKKMVFGHIMTTTSYNGLVLWRVRQKAGRSLRPPVTRAAVGLSAGIGQHIHDMIGVEELRLAIHGKAGYCQATLRGAYIQTGLDDSPNTIACQWCARDILHLECKWCFNYMLRCQSDSATSLGVQPVPKSRDKQCD